MSQASGGLPRDCPVLDPQNWLHKYGGQMYNYALVRLRRHEKAEEVVQETLLAGVQSMHSFEGRSTEKTWLFAILKSKILDALREEGKRMAGLSLDQEVNPERLLFTPHGNWKSGALPKNTCVMESQELWKIVQLCLQRLSSNQANVFVLRVLEEKEIHDICRELEVSPTVVYARLYRARLGLAKCVADTWAG